IPRRAAGLVDRSEVIGARAQRPFPAPPAGRRMAVIHVRRRAEEAFLAELALEGALGQVGMGLARGKAFDLGKCDVLGAAHGVLRWTSRRFLVTFATNIVASDTNGQDQPRSRQFPALPPGYPGGCRQPRP